MLISRIFIGPFVPRLLTALLLFCAAACASVTDTSGADDRTMATAQPTGELTPRATPANVRKPQAANPAGASSAGNPAAADRVSKIGQISQARPARPQAPTQSSGRSRVPERVLPVHTPVPGGIALLTVGSAVAPPPQVTFNTSPVYVTRRNNDWVAAVGIPLKATPGEYSVTINRRGQPTENLLFDVVDTEYKTQSLTIANKRKVNPNPDDQARIERDWVHIQKAKTTFNTKALPDLALRWPLKGRISSEFGLRRIYNGQPRNPHSGLDIAAPAGTPIVAPSAGTVIEIGDYFFNRQTAFVDHGHGLVTMYCHMSKISVAVGDNLNTGDTIGLVGETGRVTGPHLHLGVLLNGQMVNPTLLLRD